MTHPLPSSTSMRDAAPRQREMYHFRCSRKAAGGFDRRCPLSGTSANSPGSIHTGPLEFRWSRSASSLLVILHYLLKNNTTFMTGDGAGKVGHPRLSVDFTKPFGGGQPW
jgi:hypothetical protein